MRTPIEILIDGDGEGAFQRAPTPAYVGIGAQYCARANYSIIGQRSCRQPPAPGSAFCWDCLAWLRGDSNDDPLA